MAKRGLLVLVLAGTLAGGVFAQAEFRFGMGLGGLFIDDFGGGVDRLYNKQLVQSNKAPYMGVGGLIFIDVTYAELSAGYFIGEGSFEMDSSGGSIKKDVSYTGLDIGLLLKYPFEIDETFSVFPLLGGSYRLMLSVKDKDENEYDFLEDFTAIWVKLGCGLDISFSDNIHLRVEALYGLRLSTQYETKLKENNNLPGYEGKLVSSKALIGHGPEAKIGIGYKF